MVQRDALGPLPRVVVEARERLEHQERLLVVRRHAPEERERLRRPPHARVGHDELAPGLAREGRRVARVGVLAGVLQQPHEFVERAAEVVLVETDPRELVARVPEDGVALRGDGEHALVELPRRVELPFGEVVLGEREVGVRHEAALREGAEQAVVDLPRAGVLPDGAEVQREGEERLVEPAPVGVVGDELREGADGGLAVLARGLLGLALLPGEAAEDGRAAARFMDGRVEGARAHGGLLPQLVVRHREALQDVAVPRVAGVGAAQDPLEHLHLALEQAPLAPRVIGRAELHARIELEAGRGGCVGRGGRLRGRQRGGRSAAARDGDHVDALAARDGRLDGRVHARRLREGRRGQAQRQGHGERADRCAPPSEWLEGHGSLLLRAQLALGVARRARVSLGFSAPLGGQRSWRGRGLGGRTPSALGSNYSSSA